MAIERIGQAYVQVIVQGDNRDFVREIRKNDGEFREAGRRAGDGYSQGFNEGARLNLGTLTKSLNRGLGRMDRNIQEQGRLMGSNLSKSIEESLRKRGFNANVAALVTDRLEETFRKGGQKAGNAFLKEIHVHAVQAAKDIERNGSLGLTRLEATARRVGDAVGIGLGRGSRNNFLNFVGSVARNITNLFTSITFGAIRAARFVGKAFVAGFGVAREAGAGFIKATFAGLRSVGAALTKLLNPATIAAVVVGFVVLTKIVGGAVAALTSLAGAAGAVVLTLGGSLLGTLGPLVGILTPLGVGALSLVTIFGKMSDAAKAAYKAGLQPLNTQLTQLSKVANEQILKNFGTQMESLSNNLKAAGLDKLFTTIGTSISGFIQQITDGTRSGVFKQFVTDLTGFVPILSERLGNVTTQLGAGLAGVFRAAIPVSQTFLGWLDKITLRFAEFANSAEGQTKIQSFFRQTGESAKAVGGLIKDTTVLLAKLFTAGGNKTGIDLIETLRGKIRDLSEYIKKNPDVVADWFERAGTSSKKIIAGVKTIGDLLVRLGSPEVQEGLNTLLDIIVKLGNGIKKIMDFFGGNTKSPLANAIGKTLSEGPLAAITNQNNKDKEKNNTGLLNAELTSPSVQLQNVDTANTAVTTLRNNLAGLVGASPYVGTVTDNGSGATTQTNANNAHQSLLDIFGTYPGTITDQGTGAKTTATANTTKDALSQIVATYLASITEKGGPETAQMGDDVYAAVSQVAGTFTATFAGRDGGIGAVLSGIIKKAQEAAAAYSAALKGNRDKAGAIEFFASGAYVDMGRKLQSYADGGFANYKQIVAGESGREAIVPLDRPLMNVDPSVRWLSAIAQGKAFSAGPTKNVNIGALNVTSNSKDPEIVAVEVANQIAGSVT